MTAKVIGKYVRDGGKDCPYCGASGSVRWRNGAEAIDCGAGIVRIGARCGECDKRWQETYALVGIAEEVEHGK